MVSDTQCKAGLPMSFLRFVRVAPGAVLLAAALSACGTDAFNFTDKRLNPDASGPWVKPGASREDVTQALDACWAAARAQVARDQRIDDDIGATGAGGAGGSQGTQELEQAMTEFGYERRKKAIVAECMKDKGYTRR